MGHMAVCRLVTSLLTLTGRLVGLLLALGLMFIGTVLTTTKIGAALGIPLLILGLLLMIRRTSASPSSSSP
jgi:hypothetical protein